MPSINNREKAFRKLKGKYFNDTINPQELKEFNALVLRRNNFVSLKEIGNKFRNYKPSLPTEDKTININGGTYEPFSY